MGYTLTIGEAELEWNEERCGVTCSTIRLHDAPASGEPTDYTSSRWPSYSAWAEAMAELGLTGLMFNTRNGGGGFEWGGACYEPLIQTHPGCAPITRAHYEYAKHKIDQYRQRHPGKVAQYPPPIDGATPIMGSWFRDEDLSKDPKYSPALIRGEWLLYWLKYAVENLRRPVFVNS